MCDDRLMQEATIRVNPGLSLQVEVVGEEQTPVVIVDNFAADTDDVIAYACETATFGADSVSAYPGVRAELSREYVIATLNALYPLLIKVYSIPRQLRMKPQRTVYSLVSTKEGNLKVLQRLPHFDSNRPYFYAITHYLGRGDFGGTGLYRHRPTGFENVTEERLAAYVEAGNAFVQEHGDPANRYFGESDDHYELFYEIDYRPNRLIAYPGSLLHSGLVSPERDVNPDPATGRLTANVFVDFLQ